MKSRLWFLPALVVATLLGGCDWMLEAALNRDRSSEFRISSPDHDGSKSTYRQFIEVSGNQDWKLSNVTWENTTNGDSGTGDTWSITTYVYSYSNDDDDDWETTYYWEFMIELDPGENHIVVAGTDTHGDTCYDDIIIYYLTSP